MSSPQQLRLPSQSGGHGGDDTFHRAASDAAAQRSGNTRAVETHVVAEPDKAKAMKTLTAQAAWTFDRVEPIGPASLDLLTALGLGPGQFCKA
jgi:hypothetical protein